MINKIQILYTFILILISGFVFSQSVTCTEAIDITYPFPNTININGINTNVSASGSYDLLWSSNSATICQSTFKPGYVIRVGRSVVEGSTSWTITLNFDRNVNDLIISIGSAGSTTYPDTPEEYNFLTNNGVVSITPNSCGKTIIDGNKITLGGGGFNNEIGSGDFRIHSSRNFSRLTISGSGGADGSNIRICKASIVAAKPIITNLTPVTQSVCANKTPSRITVSANTSGTVSYQWYNNTINSNIGGVPITDATTAVYTPPSSESTGTTYYYVVVTDLGGSTTSDIANVITSICPPCTKIGKFISSYPLNPTGVGITMQQKQDGWPENINNGFIALESKTNGFVITRVSTLGDDINGTPTTSDSILNPKEGMISYDITDSCVKLFTNGKWKCIEKICND